MRKTKLITIFLFLLLVKPIILNAQYIYEFESYEYNDYSRYLSLVHKVNIYTGEKEPIFNLLDNEYYVQNYSPEDYYPNVDKSVTKLFADYNDHTQFVMINLEYPTIQVDLTRDKEVISRDFSYCYAYHEPTDKLYLYGQYYDPVLSNEVNYYTDFTETVNPETGETISQLNYLFQYNCLADFRDDGQRIYAIENVSMEDFQAGIEYILVVDTQTDEIIDRISFDSIVPNDATYRSIPMIMENKVLVYFERNNEGFNFIFNLDTKEKSRSIKNNIDEYSYPYISLDSKFIIEAMKKNVHPYNYTGEIRIFKVIWPDDGQIVQPEDDMIIHLPEEVTDYAHEPIYLINGAPEVFIYEADADSTKYLIRTSDAKLIRVNYIPPANIFSVFATNSILIKQKADILSGYVGVNGATPGPYLDTGAQLSIGNSSTTSDIEEVFGNSISIGRSAVIGGNVYCNTLDNDGTVIGDITTEYTFPGITDFPVFQSAAPGTEDITVNMNESLILNPADYGTVTVKKNGVITFTGGTYNFQSMKIGNNTKLLFQAATDVLIANKFEIGQKSFIGSDDGMDIAASEIVFYIEGINGTTGTLKAKPKSADIGQNSTVNANFYAPNGTLIINQRSEAKGAFWARDVLIGSDVNVTYDSAWEFEL